MIVHAYLLCYNESKIIRFILDYYSTFCEKIFVVDNQSDDNSVEIALSYPKVEVIKWSSGGKFEDQYNKLLKENLYKKYSRNKADWVITADMDEIIYHPNLIQILSEFKIKGVTVPKVLGYNMSSPIEPTPGICLTKQIRTGYRYDKFDKPIIFRTDFDMTFSAGCHPAGPGYKQMLANPSYSTSSEPMYLLHYKHIGNRHLETAKSSAVRLSETNVSKGWGTHYLKSDDDLINKTKEIVDKSYLVICDDGNIVSEV